ncbi:MAG: TetR/AcrR family transcriptional regulator [Neisseriaceae bacterium]|nr:TetR/AcrR family transcriptional regulator [Neisseriaceae bacterium]MBP6862185.1 TetR/AcrR family transcriptional regulator [Neisseriaceae bacterium]
MSPRRSPSVMRIGTAAAKHFAECGYHGASLNEIATTVGIKKASLYAHFKSKDELFMMVFDDALADEMAFVTRCFATAGEAGAHYCSQMKPRYAESVSLRFLLQTAYLPPAHLRQRIIRGYRDYLQHLQNLFTNQLQQQPGLHELTAEQQAHFSQAYLGIVDGLHVELIYTDELSDDDHFDKRRTALWTLLRQSLALAAEE